MRSTGSASPAGVLLRELSLGFYLIQELGADSKWSGHKFCEFIGLCRSKETAVYSGISQTCKVLSGFRKWFPPADLCFACLPSVGRPLSLRKGSIHPLSLPFPLPPFLLPLLFSHPSAILGLINKIIVNRSTLVIKQLYT